MGLARTIVVALFSCVLALAVVAAPMLGNAAPHDDGCCGAVSLVAASGEGKAGGCCTDGCGDEPPALIVQADAAAPSSCCALGDASALPERTDSGPAAPSDAPEKPGCPCEHGRCPCAGNTAPVVVALFPTFENAAGWPDVLDSVRRGVMDEFASTRSVGPPRRPPRV